ncbi:hypothetical protein C3F00_035640, partial [Pseudomonas sp. MWU13-2860]
ILPRQRPAWRALMSACLAVKPWSRLIDYLNHGAKGFRETRAGLFSGGYFSIALGIRPGRFQIQHDFASQYLQLQLD